MIYATLRKDLKSPCILGEIKHTIDWSTESFKCEQPEILNDYEHNLVLYSDRFKHGIAFAISIDFEFNEIK